MDNKTSIVINSISMSVGAGIILFTLLTGFNLFFFVTGGFLLFLPLILRRNSFKRSVNFEKKTYEWYKETYPESVQGNIVTCFECENNSLDIRPLINEILQNEIYCTQCKKTLYYSN